MLAQCIERCPMDLWEAPNPPAPVPVEADNPRWSGCSRPFWRIVFHNLFFTHLYMGQNEAAFRPPPAESAVHRADFAKMWVNSGDLEPYELPEGTPSCSPQAILDYLRYVDGLVDTTIDGLDLETSESGFPWYENITKISHQLMNLRHLQGHVGQLSELLMLRGIDIDWVSGRRV